MLIFLLRFDFGRSQWISFQEIAGIFHRLYGDRLHGFSGEECLMRSQHQLREHLQTGCDLMCQDVIRSVGIDVFVFAFIYVQSYGVEFSLLQGFNKSFGIN